MAPDWPVDLHGRGIVESVVTTRQPDGAWNVAALGLHAGRPVTSRTWGDTRTRRNFAREGSGYVQFTRDPVDFVEAALWIREEEEPILASADAWVRTTVEQLDAGETAGTRWWTWAHEPVECEVVRRVVPTTNRGYYAVVEATVAASRLEVDAYDQGVLRTRLEFLESVVERCGGTREFEAFDRIRAYIVEVDGESSTANREDDE